MSVDRTTLIEGAIYALRGDEYELLGFKSRVTVLRDVNNGQPLELPREEESLLVDLNRHNHADFCCTMHNTHASPHRGCILR